ncbi:M16 family metallopeptidase [Xenorhabdus entomophaga]|uniref:M16 family metallopeptidase n=1 Tax=Xenorhabdus entomophaga TaxID=3136257 RepID=UPI0030F38B9F
MFRNLLITSMSIMLLVGCASSNSLKGNVDDALPMRPDIQHFTLDNGFNVYLLPRSQKGVELRLLVKSGSLQENEKQRGLAHVTEHMAFKGTTHFPSTSSFTLLEKQGIKLGSHINAATSLNSTTYRLSLPDADKKQIGTALEILSDWASGITFDATAFDKERPVIVEEWRLRQGVGFRINHALEKLRYHGSRYAERDPIGSLDIVRHAPVSEAIDYYKTWYQPQRMVLVIVGDIDRNDIIDQIKQQFAFSAPSTPANDDPQWKTFTSQRDLLVKTLFDKEQGSRIIQFSLQRSLDAPLNTAASQYEDLLDNLWLAILNQRLSIMVDNGLLPSASINSQGTMLDENRLQQLLIAHPAGNDYLGTTGQVMTELQRLATTPVKSAELEQARQALLTRLSQQAATEQRYSHDYLANQITTALEYQMPVLNKRQQLNMSHNMLKNVTPDMLQQYMAKTLAQSSARLALIGPDTDAPQFNLQDFSQLWQQIRQSQPGEFHLKIKKIALDITPPTSGKIINTIALPLKNSEEWTLSNNIKVIVKADNSLKDGIQVSLRIPGGRSLENHQNSGVVDWALKLPESSGYGSFNARELAQFSKQHALVLRPYSELLFHGYRGQAPVGEIENLFKIMHLKIMEPQFSGQKLQQQQRVLMGLSKVPVERQFLDHINRESYQNSHLLVLEADGAWRNFTAQQLQQTNRQLLNSPQNMTLVISGAMNRNQLKPTLERWIASLSGSGQNLHWRDQGIAPRMQPMQHTYPIASSDKRMISIQYASSAIWSQKEMLALQLLDSIISQKLRFAMREQAGGVYALGFSQMLAKLPSPYYSARLNFTSAPERADEIPPAKKVMP